MTLCKIVKWVLNYPSTCPGPNSEKSREFCIRNILNECFESLSGFSHADCDGCGSRQQGMGERFILVCLLRKTNSPMIHIQREDPARPGPHDPGMLVLVWIPSNSLYAPRHRHPRSTELSFNLPRGLTIYTSALQIRFEWDPALITGRRCAFATFGDSLMRGDLETCSSRVRWCSRQRYNS